MTQLENKLKKVLDATEKSYKQLHKYNEDLKQFYARLSEISVQYRRRAPITDNSFEEEFRKTIQDLSTLSDNTACFWKELRDKYHNEYEKLLKPEHRFLIKQIIIVARAFTRQTDELFTIYKNLQSVGKDLPLRLNWWVLENTTQDFLNTTNRILFLMRSMEKHYV